MNAFPCPRCRQGNVRPGPTLPGFLSCDVCDYVPTSGNAHVKNARAVELLREAKAALAAVDYSPGAVEHSMPRTLGVVTSKVISALEALTLGDSP